MIAELKAEAPFDGVYLCVHGAMAVRGVPRPEAELARRVREAVGPKAFIAATFDLHGNEDEEFLQHADMAFAVKYFPHYDEYLQGERAARTLVRAIRGDYKPTPCHGPRSRDLADRAAMDRRLAVDGSGAARADLGGPRAGRLRQHLLRLSVRRCARCRHDRAGADQRQCRAGRARRRAISPTRIWRSARGAAEIDQDPQHRRGRGAGEAGGRAAAQRRSCWPITPTARATATWLLREIVAQGLSNTLIATLADAKATRRAQGCRRRRQAIPSTWRSADWSMNPPARRCGSRARS